jgi:methionine sulfoxide reductase heme-binding subunit
VTVGWSVPQTPLWFITRSTGEVTLVLISVMVLLGTYRAAFPRHSPALLVAIHRNLSLGAVVVAVTHTLAAIEDPFAGLRVVDALVPFIAPYRPLYVGLGTLSALLFGVALGATQLTRQFGRTAWLWIHRIGYLSWAAAVVHAVGSGSDTQRLTFLLLDLLAVAGVVATVGVLRLADPQLGHRRVRIAGTIAVVGSAVTLLAWMVMGPLQPGWARSAGTPPRLLGPTAAPSPPATR